MKEKRPTALQAIRELKKVATAKRAKANAWFFKTGKGEYGEGDRFLGVTVPQVRHVVRDYRDLPLKEIRLLILSPIHEIRLLGALILVGQFRRSSDPRVRARLHGFYLRHARRMNNWDLVDCSAGDLVGAYLNSTRRATGHASGRTRHVPPVVRATGGGQPNGLSLDGRGERLLDRLARSRNLWERRIAMIATFHAIRQGRFAPALRIAKTLLGDPHDLIHKASGWMLREAAKRGGQAEVERFLRHHAATMPRTMLRYAIEKFPPQKQKRYLNLRGPK